MTSTFGMKRLLLALVPWMALMANAHAQSRAAQVIYTHYGPLRESVYRVADECYAPIFAVEAWRWKVRMGDGGAFVKAEGHDIYLPIRTVAGRQTVPLRVAFDKIGAESAWEPGDTLVVRSPIESIKVRDGEVQIHTTLEVKTSAFAMVDPPRLAIDVRGAVLRADTPLELDAIAKVTQLAPDTVRITIDTPDAAKLARSFSPDSSFMMSLDPSKVQQTPVAATPQPDDGESVEPEDEFVDDPASQAGTEVAQPAPLLQQPNLFVDIESESSLLILMRDFGELAGPVKFRKPDPTTLEIVLPGTMLSLPADFALNTSSVSKTEIILEENATVVRMTLNRAMGAYVSANGGEVSIQLLKPMVGDGTLAGKVVVVDAGHGGHDSGAKTAGIYEKNLNLAIAKLTAQELAAAGATVLMTRKSDVYIGLLERAELANSNAADLFVSIHINSNKTANTTSGTITFYHKGSQIGKLLAECIQTEIAKVSGMPALGVWSDGRIYQNGFSVLRNTRMPGVLIEMGFINHRKDRARMVTADFQKKVAKAIVRGLRTFVGDAEE